jgi:hypothetical protein
MRELCTLAAGNESRGVCMTLYELVEWWWLLHRARRDPGKFLERAGWHLWSPPMYLDDEGATCLLLWAKYLARYGEIPGWLAPKVRRPWV